MRKSPDSTDKHVGARVRLRRMMLGRSQEWLGEQLGLTFQQVQKYEKGVNRIGAGRLQFIANVLQVPVSFFFEAQPGGVIEDRGTAPDFIADFIGTSDGIAIARAFTGISDRKLRSRIVDLIEQIAEGEAAKPAPVTLKKIA